ncbi:MAG TPA: KH domain-containing protein [Candidatus Saccharimonadales bacterium]|nr:KH domain-containing protein [Candidatus Saccharimonadales bacterium]
MSEIDQQFIEFVVKSLVGKPDAVQVKRTIDEKGVLLELTVDPEDLGRVIGKRGATAQSLRTLLRALGTKNDARYNLKIIDNGVPKPDRAPAEPKKEAEKVEDIESEVPAEEPEADAEEETTEEGMASSEEEEKTSDRLAETRKELADLDDLDV